MANEVYLVGKIQSEEKYSLVDYNLESPFPRGTKEVVFGFFDSSALNPKNKAHYAVCYFWENKKKEYFVEKDRSKLARMIEFVNNNFEGKSQ